MPTSPYQTLLGQRFDDLAPVLRDFHGQDEVWQGQAQFDVWRKPGLLPGLLAWFGGLPPPGKQVPLTLTIHRENGGERWERAFGSHRLPSFQWANQGLLYERSAPITLAQKLEVVEGALRLQVVGASKWGVPIPGFAAPSGLGVETPQGDTIAVCAQAFFPFFGELVRYEGLLRKFSF